MEFLYTRRDDGGQPYIEITGIANAPRALRVPPILDGLPVRIIGAHAFEKNEDIEQISLPDSVRAVGIFAFYGCQNLRMISLSDNTESWGTGAIYFCGSLSELRLRVVRKRFSILRDMLADTDLGLYVKLAEPDNFQPECHGDAGGRFESSGSERDSFAPSESENARFVSSGSEYDSSVLSGNDRFASSGSNHYRSLSFGSNHDRPLSSGKRTEESEDKWTAELYFPAYTHGFDEDTYARAFHTWIEGCGFAYRETVMRTGIDFRGYDQLFDRAMADGVGGVQTAANIALARLMYPASMKSSARDKYKHYLSAHGEEILLRLVRERDRERAMFLLDAGLALSEAAGKAVLEATEQGDAELVGMLMRQRGEALRESAETEEFDLGDL